jgi:hypothetical protein
MISAVQISDIPFGWKNLETVALLDAGVYKHRDGTIRIPYRLADGTTFREKIISSERSWWSPGKGLIPFGVDRIAAPNQRDSRCVVLCEGESDALAVRGAIAEWHSDPVDVLALPGASTWKKEWAAHLRGYRRVYIVPDGDPAGQHMLSRVLEDVPSVRWVMMPPGEDARSVLQARDGVDMFCHRLSAADRHAAEWLAYRLGEHGGPDAWVIEMLKMHDAGMWSA